MPIPSELEAAAREALTLIEARADHEYGPVQRKRLFEIFRAPGTPTADQAACWLGILAAHHVLPLYKYPDQMRYLASERFPLDEFAYNVEYFRYRRADEATALAIQVMRGKFERAKALRIAGDMHGAVGYYVPLQSMFIERAANRALGNAADGSYDWSFQYVPEMPRSERQPGQLAWVRGDDVTDSEWATHIGDPAACAAMAWACEVDASLVDPNNGGECWNWWLKHGVPNAEKLLEFWRWWLTEAIQKAWALAEEAIHPPPVPDPSE